VYITMFWYITVVLQWFKKWEMSQFQLQTRIQLDLVLCLILQKNTKHKQLGSGSNFSSEYVLEKKQNQFLFQSSSYQLCTEPLVNWNQNCQLTFNSSLCNSNSAKTLFINTSLIIKMYKVFEIRENLKDIRLAQTRCQKLSISIINCLY
jgi:hypothetical protein